MYYQVGGSLTNDAPSYVARQSDTDLYEALKRGDFCYVLNSRQMGKSSLLVHTRHRLQREGSDGVVTPSESDGSFVKTLKRHDGAIRGVAFTPNGKMLVSAGDDQKIWLWDLDRILSLDELAYACNWVKDYWRSHPNLKPQWETVCGG